MSEIFFSSLHSSVCDVTIMADNIGIIRICPYEYHIEENANELTESAKEQLNEYFRGQRTDFDLPLHFSSSPFTMKIWQTLKNIPYGSTASYKELASMAGSPKAYRAAGNAIHKNPIPIILPCHRIISSDGSIGGFSLPIELKQKLLELEKNNLTKIQDSVK